MNIYGIRKLGREFCQTEGSEHYKDTEIEPIELTIAIGAGEGFCIGSILKYAVRFKKTGNIEDLKKVSDFAHILAGIELDKDNVSQSIQEEIYNKIKPSELADIVETYYREKED